MYYVYTGNRFNQILIFDTYDAAAAWLRLATRLSEDQIRDAVKTPVRTGAGAFMSITE